MFALDIMTINRAQVQCSILKQKYCNVARCISFVDTE